jgi:hypothetical protein
MEMRGDVLLTFLDAHKGQAFTASELQHRTGAAKKFVGRALLATQVVVVRYGRRDLYVVLP